MMQSNWFDTKYQKTLEKATAEQALAEIAKDSRIVGAVKDALKTRDANPTMPGPSRTQTIRKAVCEALEAIS